jgi:hypothetical protein
MENSWVCVKILAATEVLPNIYGLTPEYPFAELLQMTVAQPEVGFAALTDPNCQPKYHH